LQRRLIRADRPSQFGRYSSAHHGCYVCPGRDLDRRSRQRDLTQPSCGARWRLRYLTACLRIGRYWPSAGHWRGWAGGAGRCVNQR